MAARIGDKMLVASGTVKKHHHTPALLLDARVFHSAPLTSPTATQLALSFQFHEFHEAQTPT